MIDRATGAVLDLEEAVRRFLERFPAASRFYASVMVAKCEEKTGRWNVFLDAQAARECARRKTNKAGAKIQAFRCQVCGLHHVGSRKKRS